MQDKVRAALTVMVTTPHIVNYLTWHDPKALEQARAALDLRTCMECGQGEAYATTYEHKSSCSWWKNDED
jgi:hypothetical protein